MRSIGGRVACGGSKCSSRAAFKFARASSSVPPWLATSTSRHWETYQSPSRQTVGIDAPPGARKVVCVKLQRELPGLDEVPFEGHPLGQKIYDNVSKEAWKMWVEHMKMLMNEYRLNLGTQEAQEFLIKQMDDYFFGEGAALPPDFVPPKTKA